MSYWTKNGTEGNLRSKLFAVIGKEIGHYIIFGEHGNTTQ